MNLRPYSRKGHLPTTFIGVKKLLFAFLVIAVSCGSPAKNELVNENIFNQTFETEDGAITLKEIFEENKKPMVINLWATWCTPCLEEMPYFEASHRKHFEKILLPFGMICVLCYSLDKHHESSSRLQQG